MSGACKKPYHGPSPPFLAGPGDDATLPRPAIPANDVSGFASYGNKISAYQTAPVNLSVKAGKGQLIGVEIDDAAAGYTRTLWLPVDVTGDLVNALKGAIARTELNKKGLGE